MINSSVSPTLSPTIVRNYYFPLTISSLSPHFHLLAHAGGYFRETYRSGAEPMASKGKTDEGGDLISTNTSRPVHGTHSSSSIGSSDSDDSTTCLRNQMTSMVFMATRDAPILYFGINKSDHVHYFHGPPGSSYTYVVVYPSGEVKELTLGCDVQNNESLQIVFPRGCFKAGHLNGPYCLIGEGVAPGFDFRDFTFCDEDMLQQRLAGASSDQQQSAGDRGSGSGQHVEYLMKKYVKYVKPDRRRNFDDYYGKNKLEVGK